MAFQLPQPPHPPPQPPPHLLPQLDPELQLELDANPPRLPPLKLFAARSARKPAVMVQSASIHTRAFLKHRAGNKRSWAGPATRLPKAADTSEDETLVGKGQGPMVDVGWQERSVTGEEPRLGP